MRKAVGKSWQQIINNIAMVTYLIKSSYIRTANIINGMNNINNKLRLQNATLLSQI